MCRRDQTELAWSSVQAAATSRNGMAGKWYRICPVKTAASKLRKTGMQNNSAKRIVSSWRKNIARSETMAQNDARRTTRA